MTANVSERSVGRRDIATRGAVAVVGAVLANVLLLAVVLASGAVRPFDPLQYAPVALFTAAGAVAATVVYGFLAARRADPDAAFVRIAVAVLVVSFLPDLGLLYVDPAATPAGVVVLMLMHVVAAVVIVAVLTDRWP